MERVTPEEHARLGCLRRPVDLARVRLHRAESSGMLRRLVLWASRGRAVALGNDVFLPARSDGDLRVLAHELTHCGQYQAWGPLAVLHARRGGSGARPAPPHARDRAKPVCL